MAALNANKSRRKPLTYGKATRKSAIESDQGSKSSYGETQFTELVLDGGRTTRLGWGRWETSAGDNTTYDEGKVLHTRTGLRCHATSLQDNAKVPNQTLARIKGVVATGPWTAYPSAVHKLTPDNCLDDLAIFEFPSDDSEHSERPKPPPETPRKRKRVTLTADGASASMSDPNCLQPHESLNERVDKRHICQVREAENPASEKPESWKHLQKTTRMSRRSCARAHGTSPAQTHRRIAPIDIVSCGTSQSEERILSAEDSPTYVAQLQSDIPKSGKRNLLAAGFRSCRKTGDSEKSIIDHPTPKLLKTSNPSERVQSTRHAAGLSNVIDTTNGSAHTISAPCTTPPLAEIRDPLSNRRPATDEWEAPRNEWDKPEAELTVGLRTRDCLGETSLKEDIRQVTPVQEGSTKLVHAMKQQHTPRRLLSSRLRCQRESKGQEVGGLDAETSCEVGLTTWEASALSSTQSTDPAHSGETTPTQSQAAALSQEPGPKITYARQRSYLTENVLEGNEAFSMPIDFGSDCRQGRRRRGERSMLPVIQPLLGSQAEESAVSGSSGGGIRSIHELREAGEKHKFVHGIESLLDDLENSESWSLSHKRSTLLTLATKLAVPGCALRFTECGLEQRLFDLGHSESDPIARFLLASAMMFLCNRSSEPPRSRQQYEDAKDFLFVLLKAEDDVATLARDRRNNMSRVSRSELLLFRTLLEQSPIWKYKPPFRISPQLVALTVLETMTHRFREAGDKSELLPEYALEQLIEIPQLQQSRPGGSENLDCYNVTGRLALSILDACTMVGRSTTDEIRWSPVFSAKVVELLPPTSGLPGEDAAESRNLVLRLYLNLTNNDPSLCETFSKSKVIIAIFEIIGSHFHALSQGTEGENRTLLLDNLILSLGSLTNLVECSDAARVAVLTAKSDSASILERLLQVFLDRVELAPEASEHLPPSSSKLQLTGPGGFGRRQPVQRPVWVPVGAAK